MNSDSITQVYQDMLKMLEAKEPISNFNGAVLQLGNCIEEIEKTEKKELSELALNYWRLTNWVTKSNADKKSIAYSALKRINSYLVNKQIELLDLTGQKYDDGYAADVLGVESETGASEEDLIVSEMVKPIIIFRGSVIKHGQVILGDELADNGNISQDRTETSETTIINEHADSAKDTIQKVKQNRSIFKIITGSIRRLLHRRDKNEKVL